jgi:hypothetical protein
MKCGTRKNHRLNSETKTGNNGCFIKYGKITVKALFSLFVAEFKENNPLEELCINDNTIFKFLYKRYKNFNVVQGRAEWRTFGKQDNENSISKKKKTELKNRVK